MNEDTKMPGKVVRLVIPTNPAVTQLVLSDPKQEADRLSPPVGVSIASSGLAGIVSRDLADFGTRGVWIEVDPDVAEEMGAFEETAVSAADAEDDGNGN